LNLRVLFFDLLYLLKSPPWDTEETPPEVVEEIEENGRPAGRAIDLGCGTGTNCIYLARHGWETVGVDFSAVAIWQARRKARRAGVECQLHRADVTALDFLQRSFDLALDIGCLHSLSADKHEAYAAEVIRLVQPGGLYMLYAFVPRNSGSVEGIAPQAIRELFGPAFSLQRQERGEDPSGPDSAWYWLRRTQ